MAAGHTWGDRTFDDAVVVGGIRQVREVRQFSHPGIDGVDEVDMGERGTSVVLRGKHKEDSLADLMAWVRACLDRQNQYNTLELWAGAWPMENTRMTFLPGGLRPAVGGGYYIHYEARFFCPKNATSV
jgi:hypothetical protein